jgi:hypothetical protein
VIDLIEGLIINQYKGRDSPKHTSMNAEYLVIDDNTQCKKIEHIRKVVPNICISILPRAFRIETV